jgi:hypothetical protein
MMEVEKILLNNFPCAIMDDLKSSGCKVTNEDAVPTGIWHASI